MLCEYNDYDDTSLAVERVVLYYFFFFNWHIVFNYGRSCNISTVLFMSTRTCIEKSV